MAINFTKLFQSEDYLIGPLTERKLIELLCFNRGNIWDEYVCEKKLNLTDDWSFSFARFESLHYCLSRLIGDSHEEARDSSKNCALKNMKNFHNWMMLQESPMITTIENDGELHSK